MSVEFSKNNKTVDVYGVMYIGRAKRRTLAGTISNTSEGYIYTQENPCYFTEKEVEDMLDYMRILREEGGNE